jgi:diguanylate cyclase (GGDEF)-like protein/PAS domain S-box-containing protein
MSKETLPSARVPHVTAAGHEGQRDWQASQQFRILVDGVTDYSLYMLTPFGQVATWNNGAKRIKGYSAEEIIGDHFSRFFTPEDRLAGKPEHILAVASRQGRFEAEGLRVRKDGTRFWAHVVIDAIRDNAGDLLGFAKITRDITQQKADADRIREVSRNLELALSNMSQGLLLFDTGGRLVLSNRRVGEIFGIAADAISPGDFFAKVAEIIVRGPRRQDDLPVQDEVARFHRRHQDMIGRGERRAVLEEAGPNKTISISHCVLNDGGWLTTVEDVTERLRAEAEIAHMARHDGLTGLPNRVHFNEYLKRELEHAHRGQHQVGVVAIDLDHFKETNDLHGHAVGDLVLSTLARQMRDLLQEDEFVARLGGDEFAAVIRFSGPSRLHGFVRRLETCLLSPLMVDGFQIVPGASLGVAVYPADADSAEQLLANADLAMFRAKAAFGQSVRFYEAKMDEAVRTRRAMASELWTALERQEFVVAYQVQKSIPTGETVGCEALLRWKHPERGLIPPGEFIPIAEECGAIIRIGEWVLRKACSDAAAWPASCSVAVNLSAIQLTRSDLPQVVQGILAETGLPANRLELEITESMIISDKAKTLKVLRHIKSLGVRIALDDFGTGYSSLDTLKSFPFDKIKLDRTFMEEVTQSPQAKAVIRAILALGHSLSVPVLAEGVETEEQLAVLRQEGCDEVQGFLLGYPVIGGTCERL